MLIYFSPISFKSPGEVNKRSPKITKAEALNVHVVSVEFLNEVEKGGDILKLIPQHSIAPWGSDVSTTYRPIRRAPGAQVFRTAHHLLQCLQCLDCVQRHRSC